MLTVKTLRAQYDVEAQFSGSKRAAQYNIDYVRADDRLHYVEALSSTRDSNEDGTHRVVIDGKRVVSFYDQPAKESQNARMAAIRASGGVPWAEGNDILRLAGFVLTTPEWERAAKGGSCSIVGHETINGEYCARIRLETPYTDGHVAATYFSVAAKGGRYMLMKYNTFVDDKADNLLYERRYTYAGGGEGSLLPTAIEVDQYQIAADGARTLEHTKRIAVHKAVVNGPVTSSDFEFAFPFGTRVQDFVKGVNYVIGQDIPDIEKRLDRLASMADIGNGAGATTTESVAGNDTRVAERVSGRGKKSSPSASTLSTVQSRYWLYWAAVACGMVLIAIAAMKLLRRRRA